MDKIRTAINRFTKESNVFGDDIRDNSIEDLKRRFGIWFDATESLIDRIPISPPGRVLDVGAGYGLSSALLTLRGWKVVAIDIDTRGLMYISEDYEFQSVIEQPIEHLHDESDRGFDIVFCHHVLEHCPSPLHVLERINQLSNIGAYIAVGIPPITNNAESGHINNISLCQLVYMLAMMGFDCAEDIIDNHTYDVRVVAKKIADPLTNGIMLDHLQSMIPDRLVHLSDNGITYYLKE